MLRPAARPPPCAARHRRRALPLRTVAAAAAAGDDAPSSRSYGNWLALPLQPGPVRRTVASDAGSGVWTFDQALGVLDVVVNIRMTVLRLSRGRLLVYAPVAPTDECLRLLAALPGEVAYIVLPTTAVRRSSRPPSSLLSLSRLTLWRPDTGAPLSPPTAVRTHTQG